jgi:hypothetical protein
VGIPFPSRIEACFIPIFRRSMAELRAHSSAFDLIRSAPIRPYPMGNDCTLAEKRVLSTVVFLGNHSLLDHGLRDWSAASIPISTNAIPDRACIMGLAQSCSSDSQGASSARHSALIAFLFRDMDERRPVMAMQRPQ